MTDFETRQHQKIIDLLVQKTIQGKIVWDTWINYSTTGKVAVVGHYKFHLVTENGCPESLTATYVNQYDGVWGTNDKQDMNRLLDAIQGEDIDYPGSITAQLEAL